MALLLLASAWAQISDVDLQVVTVDHGLRPEAAAEASFVAAVCEGLDLPHLTLAWEGTKPTSGIASAAREMRYQLIEEFARDFGIKTILTGHTADDQAETVYMRASRGDDVQIGHGLAGMAKHVVLPRKTNLIRPLLEVSRADLRQYLLENDQTWIEDPSNLDESYERVRVRKTLLGKTKHSQRLQRFSTLNGRYRKTVSQRASQVLSDHLKFLLGPIYRMPLEVLDSVEQTVKIAVLKALIAMAGGRSHLPSTSSIENFLEDPENRRFTVSNSVIEVSKDVVQVYREKRNLPSILIPPGEKTIWDGRLRISNRSSITYFCGPLDKGRCTEVETKLGRKLPVSPRAALGATPFICGSEDDLYLPFIKGFEKPAYLDVEFVTPALEHFCPSFDFAFLDVLSQIRANFQTA